MNVFEVSEKTIRLLRDFWTFSEISFSLIGNYDIISPINFNE
jgi:hypothetical protein